MALVAAMYFPLVTKASAGNMLGGLPFPPLLTFLVLSCRGGGEESAGRPRWWDGRDAARAALGQGLLASISIVCVGGTLLSQPNARAIPHSRTRCPRHSLTR